MTSIALSLQFVALTLAPAVAQDAPAVPETASTEPQRLVVSDASDAEYNLEVAISFAGDLAGSEVVVRFDEQETGENFDLNIAPTGMRLVAMTADGAVPLVEDLPITVAEDGSALVTVCRRAETVRVLDGRRRVARVWRPAAPGKVTVMGAPGAFTEDGVYYQPYAPPEFTDDFMRGEEDSTGEWQIVSGTWENTALVDSLKFVAKSSNSFAFAAHADPVAMATTGFEFWDDLVGSVAVRLVEPGRAGLAFRVVDDQNYYALLLEFGSPDDPEHALLTLRKTVAGVETVLATESLSLPMGQWFELAVSESGGLIRASLDDIPVFEVADDDLAQGRVGLVAADCATVYFDDVSVSGFLGLREDFETGGAARWQTITGEWAAGADGKDESHWLATAGREPALAVAGKPSWTDYLLEGDVRPAKGQAGLCFLYADAANYWLWRYSPGPGKQELVHVVEGAETVVDENDLSLPGNRWTRVALRAGADYVRAEVEGAAPLDALLPGGGAGLVGFWAAKGADAGFDNIRVSFPPGYVHPRIPATMVADAEMSEQFTNPAEGWFSVTDIAHKPQAVGMNWNKGEYFDPVDISFPLTNVTAAAGKVTVTIEGDQTGTGGGYQLALSTEAGSASLQLQLSSRGDGLATGQVEVSEGGVCTVKFGRRGSYIVTYIDDQLALTYRVPADESSEATQ